MDQDMEKDLIELTDEEGNTELYEVLDTMFYNGTEYALVGEYVEDETREDVGCMIMQINTITDETGEELEEFLTLEDETLEETLFQLFTTRIQEDQEADE